MGANINVEFDLGIGQLNARLYRGESVLATGSISVSGTIPINDVVSGDVIEIDGVCTGTATVTINVPTRRQTPQAYQAGNIFDSFIVQ